MGKQDSIVAFGNQMIEAGVATQDDLDAVRKDIDTLIYELFLKAIDEEISPRIKNTELIGETMFSNGSVDSFSDDEPRC